MQWLASGLSVLLQATRNARELAFWAATAWTSMFTNRQTTLRGATYAPVAVFVFNLWGFS